MKSFPKNIGTIDESFQGTNGKTILFIQDAHDSLEAQMNIAKLVTHFVKQGAETVFEEGYAGEVPTEKYFGGIQDPQIRRKVSYYYLDQLKIGAAEFAHINRRAHSKEPIANSSNSSWQLIGTDDLSAYLENVHAFADAEKARHETESNLHNIFNEIANIGRKIFSKEAQAWIRDYMRYENGRLSFTDYLVRTMPLFKTKEQEAWPVLSAAHALSTQVHLRGELGSDENKIREVTRVQKEQAEALIQFAGTSEVLREMASAQQAIENKLFKTPEEIQLWKFLKALRRLAKLSRLKLNPTDLEILKAEMAELDTEKLAKWIAHAKHGPVVLSKKWESQIKAALRFYELAQIREQAVEKTLLKWNQEPGTKNQVSGHEPKRSRDSDLLGSRFLVPGSERVSVLVFGGFHREGITEILRRNGFSYQVITPHISEISSKHQKLYHKLMAGPVLAKRGPPPVVSKSAARPLNLFLTQTPEAIRAEIRALSDFANRSENRERSLPEFSFQTEKFLAGGRATALPPTAQRSEIRIEWSEALQAATLRYFQSIPVEDSQKRQRAAKLIQATALERRSILTDATFNYQDPQRVVETETVRFLERFDEMRSLIVGLERDYGIIADELERVVNEASRSELRRNQRGQSERFVPSAQRSEIRIKHPLLEIEIEGGDEYEQMRVRRILAIIAKKIPVSQAALIKKIQLEPKTERKLATHGRLFPRMMQLAGTAEHAGVIKLYDTWNQSEKELIHVLAHEIGHVVHRLVPEARQTWREKVRILSPDERIFSIRKNIFRTAGLASLIEAHSLLAWIAFEPAAVFDLYWSIMGLMIFATLALRALVWMDGHVRYYSREDFAESYARFILKRKQIGGQISFTAAAWEQRLQFFREIAAVIESRRSEMHRNQRRQSDRSASEVRRSEIRSRENGLEKIYKKYPELLEIEQAWQEFQAEYPDDLAQFNHALAGGIHGQSPFEWIENISRRFSLKFDRRIVDVGSGNGLAALAFHIITGAEVVSVEMDSDRFAVLQKFIKFLKEEKGIEYPNVIFQSADFMNLPLQENDFIYFYFTEPQGYENAFGDRIAEHLNTHLPEGATFVSPSFFFENEAKGSGLEDSKLRSAIFKNSNLKYRGIYLPQIGALPNTALVLTRRSEIRVTDESKNAVVWNAAIETILKARYPGEEGQSFVRTWQNEIGYEPLRQTLYQATQFDQILRAMEIKSEKIREQQIFIGSTYAGLLGVAASLRFDFVREMVNSAPNFLLFILTIMPVGIFILIPWSTFKGQDWDDLTSVLKKNQSDIQILWQRHAPIIRSEMRKAPLSEHVPQERVDELLEKKRKTKEEWILILKGVGQTRKGRGPFTTKQIAQAEAGRGKLSEVKIQSAMHHFNIPYESVNLKNRKPTLEENFEKVKKAVAELKAQRAIDITVSQIIRKAKLSSSAVRRLGREKLESLGVTMLDHDVVNERARQTLIEKIKAAFKTRGPLDVMTLAAELVVAISTVRRLGKATLKTLGVTLSLPSRREQNVRSAVEALLLEDRAQILLFEKVANKLAGQGTEKINAHALGEWNSRNRRKGYTAGSDWIDRIEMLEKILGWNANQTAKNLGLTEWQWKTKLGDRHKFIWRWELEPLATAFAAQLKNWPGNGTQGAKNILDFLIFEPSELAAYQPGTLLQTAYFLAEHALYDAAMSAAIEKIETSKNLKQSQQAKEVRSQYEAARLRASFLETLEKYNIVLSRAQLAGRRKADYAQAAIRGLTEKKLWEQLVLDIQNNLSRAINATEIFLFLKEYAGAETKRQLMQMRLSDSLAQSENGKTFLIWFGLYDFDEKSVARHPSSVRSEMRIQGISEEMPIWYFLKAFGIDPAHAAIESSDGVWGHVRVGQNSVLGLTGEDLQSAVHESLGSILTSYQDVLSWRSKLIKASSPRGQYDAYLLTYHGLPAALVWPELGEFHEVVFYPLHHPKQDALFGADYGLPIPSDWDEFEVAMKNKLRMNHGITLALMHDATKTYSGAIIEESFAQQVNSGFYFPTVFPPNELTSVKTRGKLKSLVENGKIKIAGKIGVEIGSGAGVLLKRMLEFGAKKAHAVDISLLKLMNTQAQISAEPRRRDLILHWKDIPSADFYVFNAPNYAGQTVRFNAASVNARDRAENANVYMGKETFTQILSRAAQKANPDAQFLMRIFISPDHENELKEVFSAAGWDIETEEIIKKRFHSALFDGEGFEPDPLAKKSDEEKFYLLKLRSRSEMRIKAEESAAAWSNRLALGSASIVPDVLLPVFRNFWMKIFFQNKKAANVLEIGSGNMFVSKIARESKLETWAIDQAQPAATPDDIQFRKTTAEQMDRAGLPQNFKLAVSQYGIEYGNWDQTLPQLNRQLVLGGKAIFITHHPDSLFSKTVPLQLKQMHEIRDSKLIEHVVDFFEKLVRRAVLAKEWGAQTNAHPASESFVRISKKLEQEYNPKRDETYYNRYREAVLTIQPMFQTYQKWLFDGKVTPDPLSEILKQLKLYQARFNSDLHILEERPKVWIDQKNKPELVNLFEKNGFKVLKFEPWTIRGIVLAWHIELEKTRDIVRSEQRMVPAQVKIAQRGGTVLISREELANLSKEHFEAFFKYAYQQAQLKFVVYGNLNSGETRLRDLKSIPSAGRRVSEVLDEEAALKKVKANQQGVLFQKSVTQKFRPLPKNVKRARTDSLPHEMALGFYALLESAAIKTDQNDFYFDPSGWITAQIREHLLNLVFAYAA